MSDWCAVSLWEASVYEMGNARSSMSESKNSLGTQKAVTPQQSELVIPVIRWLRYALVSKWDVLYVLEPSLRLPTTAVLLSQYCLISNVTSAAAFLSIEIVHIAKRLLAQFYACMSDNNWIEISFYWKMQLALYFFFYRSSLYPHLKIF